MSCDGGKYKHVDIQASTDNVECTSFATTATHSSKMGRFDGRPLDLVWFIFLFVS